MIKESKENLIENKEDLEKMEERERVKTVLRDFCQEQQKNMPVHMEIMELAEKLKKLFENANDFFEKYKGKRYGVGKNLFKIEGYKEISLQWEEKDGEVRSSGNFKDVNKKLNFILNSKELQTEEEESDIKNLIQEIDATGEKLDEKVKELWRIRENIAKELILIIPEFADFKDGKFKKSISGDLIYGLDKYIKVFKIFETKTGTQEEQIYFNFDDRKIRHGFNNLESKFNITEQELKEIKNLDWSDEEKENLKNLMEDVNEYKTGAEKLKEGLLKSANFKFKDGGADVVKDEFIRAFIRQLYEDYKLPVLHKERVVQEIMTGTFIF